MPWTEEEIDRRMGRLLKAGVFIAAGVMLVGGIIYLFVERQPPPDYTQFHSDSAVLGSMEHIFRAALRGDAAAIIQIGTLLMIATPVARVAFAAYAYLRSHDRLYVVISSIVLVLLLYGIFFGT
jgi:uncharacterized membrane protein